MKVAIDILSTYSKTFKPKVYEAKVRPLAVLFFSKGLNALEAQRLNYFQSSI